MNTMNDLLVGLKFSDYGAVETFMRQYETDNKQKFTKLSSRSLAKSSLAQEYNKDLHYFDIIYCCKFGRKTQKSISTGQRAVR